MSAPPGRMRSSLLMGAAVACTVVGVLPNFLVSGLALLVRADLAFDEAGLGLVIGVFYGASALTAIPGGRIAERLGARWTLALGVALAVTALGAVAGLARSLPVLAACLAVGGMSNGLIQPAANLALARGIPAHRLGFAFGVKQSAVPTATLLAGAAVPVVGLTIGWRWAFAGAALVAVTLLVVVAVSAPGGRASRLPRQPRVRIDPALFPSLLRVAAASCCGTVAANSLGAFYVESTVASGRSLATAGLLLSCASVAGIVTRLVGGWLAGRRSTRSLRAAGLMMATGTLGLVLLAFGSGTAALVVATLVAFVAGWGWPGLLQLGIVQAHMRTPAAASGVVHSGALTGGLVGPVVFGLVAAEHGFTPAWLMVAAVGLLGGCLLLREGRTA
ncbi:MAG: MFS transporter [Streptosporangiales bacterium]|nr:MFS transporter [Streptosporangiales bacterium]